MIRWDAIFGVGMILVMIVFGLWAIIGKNKEAKETQDLMHFLHELHGEAVRAAARAELRTVAGRIQRLMETDERWNRFHTAQARRTLAYIEGRLTGVKA